MEQDRSPVTASRSVCCKVGNGLAPPLPVWGATSVRRRAKEAGFSLAEALVAVAIIGFLAMMFIPYFVHYIQRARAEGSAFEVRNFVLQAQTLMLGTSSPVTVTVAQQGGRWVATLTPAVEPAAGTYAATLPRRFEFPEYMTVDGLSLGAGNWPQQSGAYMLRCDTFGRTLDPTQVPPALIPSEVTLRVTHTATVAGRLQPRNVWEIRVSPLWNVTVVQRRAP